MLRLAVRVVALGRVKDHEDALVADDRRVDVLDVVVSAKNPGERFVSFLQRIAVDRLLRVDRLVLPHVDEGGDRLHATKHVATDLFADGAHGPEVEAYACDLGRGEKQYKGG